MQPGRIAVIYGEAELIGEDWLNQRQFHRFLHQFPVSLLIKLFVRLRSQFFHKNKSKLKLIEIHFDETNRCEEAHTQCSQAAFTTKAEFEELFILRLWREIK